jgi:UMF1 family MFS transporter
MGVISLGFPLYVKSLTTAERADTVYTAVTAVSAAVVFVLSPVLGVLTDRSARRMPFLVSAVAIVLAATLLFDRVAGLSGLVLSLAAFGLANIAFQAQTQFYDSLLPAVSTPTNRGRVSGLGVGVGFLGSYVAIGLSLALTHSAPSTFFTTIAILVALTCLPCFLFVSEPTNPLAQPITGRAVADSFRQAVSALRQLPRNRPLFHFLLARMLYSDAINTVILVMALFVTNVAVARGATAEVGEGQAKLILFTSVTTAVLGGVFTGRLVDRAGPRRILLLVLSCWALALLLAILVGLTSLPLWTMYLVGAVTGLAFGGVSTSDRPLLLELTPPDRIGEHYGLYGMVGRFAAILGPALWAATTYAATEFLHLSPLSAQSLGLGVLLTLLLTGLVLLRTVATDSG